MILKTAYYENKAPTFYCPFPHGEITFSNGTKCPVYTKGDGVYALEKSKELGLIDEIELNFLKEEINKSPILEKELLFLYLPVNSEKVKDVKISFEMMIMGLINDCLQSAQKGSTLEINLVQHVEDNLKKQFLSEKIKGVNKDHFTKYDA